MTQKQGKIWQRIRIGSQILFTFLFFYLLIKTGQTANQSFQFSDYFFYFDPLILILNVIATHQITFIFLLALIPLFLTFVFGRFFCGWVCPMGAIQQFFTRIFRKSNREKKVDKKLLKLKYIILIMVIVLALMGTHIGGWLDPFSLLTRSFTTVIAPAANYSIELSLKAGALDSGLISKGLKPFYDFSKKNILTNRQRVYVQSVIIGIIFLVIILLNLYKRRFFCNYLCPLGALYGLVAKFSLLNLKTGEACKACNVCARNCTYNGSPYQDYMKSECLVCMNCITDCDHDEIRVKYDPPVRENRTPINLGRRQVIGSALSGLFVAALPRIAPASGIKIHGFTRPPGSVSEVEFLQKCIRCSECIQVCPTNFIQPALLQTGFDGIWTPILNAQTGYCEYECHKCTQVCPTKAISKLTLNEKKAFKIGTAVIDKNRCYTYADGYNCAVCEEHCPVPEKAIRFREVDLWDFRGKQVRVKQIYVIPDLCTGCGICEHVCPRSDAPGILNSAEEEQREALY
ncbi:MAG: 4Fe-4S binding protein [Candidatus Aminicenantes bacterium]|nr:4Fe-4S binding protein [Candidatus Aminicenantes bacterium]